jgi:hypothetical protein
MVAIVLLATLSATSLLNFPALTLVVSQFIDFAWNVLLGLLIFGVGLWLADSIVNLAFGLTLGAVAVAAAIAFGLGGREIAGQELKSLVNALHQEGEANTPDSGQTKPQ